MPHVIRNCVNQQIERFRKSFLQFQDLPFNDYFPATVIADIIKHTPHQRTSVFTPLVTLKAFIFQVLSDDGSCKHAVAGVLADRLGDGKAANTVNTGPYCKARKRLPSKQLTEAVTNVGSRLH
ncbi:MAG: IS4 family transposase, partial [Gallionella sp.]